MAQVDLTSFEDQLSCFYPKGFPLLCGVIQKRFQGALGHGPGLELN